jgi:phosphohistidine phosphatase SixA
MIVFVLRHADRKPEPQDALSAAGIVRAKLLARMLGESGVRTAYCSDANRTQVTLKPLKLLLGAALAVHVVPMSGPGGIAGHVQHIVDAVKALPVNATSVIVGHSNTIGPIIHGLTHRTVAPIAANEFDRLFVLAIPATDTPTVTPLRYGPPT